MTTWQEYDDAVLRVHAARAALARAEHVRDEMLADLERNAVPVSADTFERRMSRTTTNQRNVFAALGAEDCRFSDVMRLSCLSRGHTWAALGGLLKRGLVKKVARGVYRRVNTAPGVVG